MTFNQISLPRTAAASSVAAAFRRGLLALMELARPPRGSASAGPERYFESGLMKRELHRL
jgi:hypothetical protein